jgi:hypothetical protein
MWNGERFDCGALTFDPPAAQYAAKGGAQPVTCAVRTAGLSRKCRQCIMERATGTGIDHGQRCPALRRWRQGRRPTSCVRRRRAGLPCGSGSAASAHDLHGKRPPPRSTQRWQAARGAHSAQKPAGPRPASCGVRRAPALGCAPPRSRTVSRRARHRRYVRRGCCSAARPLRLLLRRLAKGVGVTHSPPRAAPHAVPGTPGAGLGELP